MNPILARGSAGKWVETLQHYLHVTVDGKFGPETEAAVRSFQVVHPPLEVDGIVGPKTWEALLEPPVVEQPRTPLWQTLASIGAMLTLLFVLLFSCSGLVSP
jgi:peptidoglycan hydrolase-like protein with peptidoglycan-binding domain